MMRTDSLFVLYYFDGTDDMADMEVFADASEMAGHLAIGALLFRKKDIKPFETEWRQMLRDNDLSHFHMTDCNSAKGEFQGKSDEDCDNCARRAIALILKYATKGTIFSVKKTDFYEIITKEGIVPNPFTLGAWVTLFDVAGWANKNDQNARISYVFEAGDEHQSDADKFLKGIADDDERRARFRYRRHEFVLKRDSLPAQAADILAWHGAKHLRRKMEGVKRLRGDFQAIVDGLQVADAYHDRDMLEKIVGIAKHRAGPKGNKVAGVAFRYHSLTPKELKRELARIR